MGLRNETIAQGGRLYAANYLPQDSLIMTCDMDLIPLSDYWHPKIEDITIYGHDLTWHSFYPMGYIAMSGANWKKYMNLTGLTENDFDRDARETQRAFVTDDWESWWNFDWDLITKRLKPFAKQLTFVDRGQIEFVVQIHLLNHYLIIHRGIVRIERSKYCKIFVAGVNIDIFRAGLILPDGCAKNSRRVRHHKNHTAHTRPPFRSLLW